ncbi:MAG: hypothetical protein EBW69_05515 [Nitrosomonadales bacterium]|nr:hypothetical protein [Nitrosomonadales bacterium]
MEELKTYDNVKSWISNSASGQRAIYYEGYLPKDLKSGNSNIRQRARAIHEVTYHNKDKGNITLVQKKKGEFRYQYIAIKT